ncbi:unnamed protein product [Rotaria sp. Silwood2]|nr:unnamed protein product [Rotaria sp. Silwood2]CAF4270917.1 unnamed protein product [Rotaria sp. Silwood2]
MFHLENIVKTYNSKFDHALVMSDLNPSDRQNYRSCEKVSSDEVLAILESNDDTYATFLYIKLLRYIIDAFINKDFLHRAEKLTILQNIKAVQDQTRYYQLQFPRHHKHKKNNEKILILNQSLTVTEIQAIVLQAFEHAKELVSKLDINILLEEYNLFELKALSFETYNSLKKSNRVIDSATSDTFMDSDSDNDNTDDFNSNDDEDQFQYDLSMINDDDDIPDNILQSDRTDFSGMRVFDSIDQAHKKSYFEVEINGKNKFLHKQTACWYLTEGKGHLSSDRLSLFTYGSVPFP